MISQKRLLKNNKLEHPMINHEVLTLEGLSLFIIPKAATLNMAAAEAIAIMPYPRSWFVNGLCFV